MKPERTAEEEEVARTYAKALRTKHHSEWFWSAINEEIIDRWSLTALRRIKRRAWQLASTSRPALPMTADKRHHTITRPDLAS